MKLFLLLDILELRMDVFMMNADVCLYSQIGINKTRNFSVKNAIDILYHLGSKKRMLYLKAEITSKIYKS